MRTSFALLALLVASATASAQPTFGLKAGLNVADVTNTFEDVDGVFDAQPRLGFVGGVLVDLPLNPQFGIRAEALYSQKGARENFEGDETKGGGGDTVLKMDYIEVPLLARVAVEPTPTLEVGLMAGPAFAFNVVEKLEIDGTNVREGDDFVQSFDTGIAVGAEVGSGPFFVDFRYTLGLLNVAQELDEDDDEPKNGVFSVTGVFKLGR